MKRHTRAFTIVELLVVVSIIALLVGILLPAITKARDQALITQSKANMRNIAAAFHTYAGEYNNRQYQFLPDNFSRFGGNFLEAWNGYDDAYPNHLGFTNLYIRQFLGLADGTYYSVPLSGYMPMGFQGNEPAMGEVQGFGSFRLLNAGGINQYFNARFYDPAFYAPKDKVVRAIVEPIFTEPDDSFDIYSDATYYSSYCMSPAGLYAPAVLSEAGSSDTYFNSPWELPAAFRSPTYGQAQYPTLKTHVMEHHWLQGLSESECNRRLPASSGTYEGCEPWYFNGGIQSSPVILFYDGHIDQIGMNTFMDSHSRVSAQSAEAGIMDSGSSLGGAGLWSESTPLTNGYFENLRTDWTEVSAHCLTREGIKGRDVTAQ